MSARVSRTHLFGDGVQGRRSLVVQEDGRILQYGAGDGDTLLFPTWNKRKKKCNTHLKADPTQSVQRRRANAQTALKLQASDGQKKRLLFNWEKKKSSGTKKIPPTVPDLAFITDKPCVAAIKAASSLTEQAAHHTRSPNPPATSPPPTNSLAAVRETVKLMRLVMSSLCLFVRSLSPKKSGLPRISS